MSDDLNIGPVTDDERKQLGDCAASARMEADVVRQLLAATDADHATACIAREALTGGDLALSDLAWLYAYAAVRLYGQAGELEQAREAFHAETAKRLEHEQVIAGQRRALVEDRERIARAIEVKQGDRCPTCQGRAANWETAARCGGGHRWTRPNRDTLAHVDFAAIARAGGAA